MRFFRRVLPALLPLLAALAASLAHPAVAQGVSGGRLPTRWDKLVSPTAPWPEYPRPQMTRAAWLSLNGSWAYGLTAAAAADPDVPPAAYSGRILVPYPYESALSGVAKPSPAAQRLWYRRAFAVPAAWRGERVLLHFGAVNYDSRVYVNGRAVARHVGGYDPFTCDVTDALRPGGANTLTVSAQNPLRSDTADAQVLGKQRLHPGSIFYTASTGIWQSVWLEPVPAAHIDDVALTPDIDRGRLQVTVDAAGPGAGGAPVQVAALDGGVVVARARGAAGTALDLPIPRAHLWSPADPHLYTLRVALTPGGGRPADSVGSYFALRKISLGPDAGGRTCILLNNRPLLEIGALDQGYWPDGIYTAPTDDAQRSDIAFAKQMGMNLLRKHAKVEPERWYYWADKLGMLVWQDMPQCFAGPGGQLTDAAKAQWLVEWRREIASHRDHPSIVVWTPFNEGWGQHDTAAIVALTKQLDPTRLVDDASGWNDEGVGDIRDTHAYPGPGTTIPEPHRAAVNGEFGGVTLRVPGHMWTADVVGYGATLHSPWRATQHYQALLKAAYGLHATVGTSAFVYTQLTDVEQESNGLMTYDRRVVKLLPRFVAAADQGAFPALPPDPSPDMSMVPTSAVAPQIWRYTFAEPAAGWQQPDFPAAAAWKSGPAPFGQGYGNIGTPWTDTPGDIWLRRDFTIAGPQPILLPADLDIVTEHDEDVEVYVNGVLAASATGYVGDYARLPMSEDARATLHAGVNTLAAHCHQTVGGQIIDVGIAAPGDGP